MEVVAVAWNMITACQSKFTGFRTPSRGKTTGIAARVSVEQDAAKRMNWQVTYYLRHAYFSPLAWCSWSWTQLAISKCCPVGAAWECLIFTIMRECSGEGTTKLGMCFGHLHITDLWNRRSIRARKTLWMRRGYFLSVLTMLWWRCRRALSVE